MPLRDSLPEIFGDVTSLPSLPAAVNEALQLLQQEESSMHDIAAALERDPALTMKILRLANSAYFGLRQQVTSVEHAAALLGRRVIRNVVLSASAFSEFSKSTEDFILFSIATGTVMESLAARSSAAGVSRGDAFTFGVLNHVGTLMLLEYLPAQLAEAHKRCEHEGLTLTEAEEATIGVNHAEAGAVLCRHWGLPERFSLAIEHYQTPARCPDDSVRPWSALLGIATFVCLEAGYGNDPHAFVYLDDDFWNAGGLEPDVLVDVKRELAAASESIRELAAACT